MWTFPETSVFAAEIPMASFIFFPTASEYFLGLVICVAGSWKMVGVFMICCSGCSIMEGGWLARWLPITREYEGAEVGGTSGFMALVSYCSAGLGWILVVVVEVRLAVV